MFIPNFIVNLFGGLAFSHKSYTVYSSLYFNSSWRWDAIIIWGQGYKFLLDDVISCGHQSSHQPSCSGSASHSAACRVHSDIFVWQSWKEKKSWSFCEFSVTERLQDPQDRWPIRRGWLKRELNLMPHFLSEMRQALRLDLSQKHLFLSTVSML